jgi:hypothetical protein
MTEVWKRREITTDGRRSIDDKMRCRFENRERVLECIDGSTTEDGDGVRITRCTMWRETVRE